MNSEGQGFQRLLDSYQALKTNRVSIIKSTQNKLRSMEDSYNFQIKNLEEIRETDFLETVEHLQSLLQTKNKEEEVSRDRGERNSSKSPYFRESSQGR